MISNFDNVLFRCIDETLAGVMGLVARDALYLDMLTKVSVTREEIPRHLDSLVGILESMLGRDAANAISRAIAKRLYASLQLDFVERAECDLVEYVSKARTIVNKEN